MKETYVLITDPANAGAACDESMALFRLDEDAVIECHPVESSSIDREYAPLQLYSCDRALVPNFGARTVHLGGNGKEDPPVYTLMLVSHPFPRQSVILTSAEFDREEYRGGAGMFIAPFLEMLKKQPIDTLTAQARKLLRQMSESNALLKEDGSSMTYDDMMDLLL